ncbi:DUF4153 domain-containing protein [Aquibacillus salsiterrae]|uniref:DUF4173 domain-containing protein n=1 Tax=Aquibacillus salsiterrae TaxID=2950439 RepID=A0A9X3WDX2_9BACI|nr:DUF4173 domain-containing protein [Aquibacillus salsiterrae]MDC3417238.1 DUF4173 domain-containing protein [Aquibacillus salsiterrae]
MEKQLTKQNLLFLLVCLGLAILAELSFFHGEIGISYLVFVTAFYAVFFVHFRTVMFTHRRMGMLLVLVIWLLSISYFLYDHFFFYWLNILLIPGLIFTHIVLITSAKRLEWFSLPFVQKLFEKLLYAASYNNRFISSCFRYLFKNIDEKTATMIKRVGLGLLIGVPLLGIVTSLLMSADSVFESLVGRIPNIILELDFQEQLLRSLIVIFYLFVFFGVFQVLTTNSHTVKQKQLEAGRGEFPLVKHDVYKLDGVVVATILILLNSVYLLFTVIQFSYFFGTALQEGLTYAEYARKGFFELVLVTLINWTVLIACLTTVREIGPRTNMLLKVLYSSLVVVSGVMLASAFQRLSLYEAAYGFTFDRILAHAFMIYLLIIFAYTLMRVWMEHLALRHFYFVTALLFYTALNIVPLDKIIVEYNMERYVQSGKIDVDYLNRLSYTGVDGLIDLYEKNPDYPELRSILSRRIKWANDQETNWQSYNISKAHVVGRLKDLELE